MPRTIVHTGRKIRVAVEEELGADGQLVRRDIVLHPGAVVILPVIDAGHVCLLRNHRPAVGETLWEVPAGTLEPNEPIEIAAARELQEETGYTAARWTKLGEFFPSPGVLSEVMHLFVAEGLTPGAMKLEPCERIEPRTVGWDEALRWAHDGTLRDAKTILALLLWEKRRRE